MPLLPEQPSMLGVKELHLRRLLIRAVPLSQWIRCARQSFCFRTLLYMACCYIVQSFAGLRRGELFMVSFAFLHREKPNCSAMLKHELSLQCKRSLGTTTNSRNSLNWPSYAMIFSVVDFSPVYQMQFSFPELRLSTILDHEEHNG